MEDTLESAAVIPGMLPVTVVVPTIGRVDLVRACVQSIVACEPAPQQILVVDQSGGAQVIDAVAAVSGNRANVIACDGRGIARGTNTGIRHARHELVLVTHDDCTVAADWVEASWQHLRQHPDALFTGRVLPPRDAVYVPSTKDDLEPYDYTGSLAMGVLYPANMAFRRDALLAFGGFDERAGLNVAAEDNDLCYRWLVAGRRLRYEPDMVVWHHDWRSPEELIRTHVQYAHGQGAFYAKHLWAHDWRVVRLLVWDLRTALRAQLGGIRHHRPRWQDERREMFLPLLVGVARGLRQEHKMSRETGG
jgi:GT2 family glycosyltransferase